MSSSRLPGKSLADLGGRPLLAWCVERAAQAHLVDEVVVATSTDPSDDPVAAAAERLGVRCVRGSLSDVLDRYRQACVDTDARTVVRLTGDCPLIAPEIIDAGVETLDATGADYVSTSLDGRYPRGLDTEVFRATVLLAAAAEAVDESEREHVTLFLYRRPERFRCRPIPPPDWARQAGIRVTVDEQADLDLVRAVVAALEADVSIPAETVVRFLAERPGLAGLNADVPHRTVS